MRAPSIIYDSQKRDRKSVAIPAGLALRIGPLIVLLFFWSVSVTNLDRFPLLHNDETPLLAAGYKLFQQGVYGLDMYTGHQSREQLYLEVMPLMPWLQGLSAQLIGVGIWQMRFIPVVAGLLSLALTFALARQLADPTIGTVAMILMVLWKWTPGGDSFFNSGVALVDLARIARYDILIAPLGLTVLLSWVRGRRTGATRAYFLCGICVGLAGLANLYGLFWLAVLLIIWVWEDGYQLLRINQLHIAPAGAVVAGSCLAMAPWICLVLWHWPLFVDQFAMHSDRFGLLTGRFYVHNLLQESQRYFLGAGQPATYVRLGFWLALLGLPASLLWLGGTQVRHNRRGLWLLVPCLVLPLLLAMLIQRKAFGYLLLVMPFWVIAVAWALTSLWRTSGQWRRLGIGLAVTWLVVEGMVGIGRMQIVAAHTSSTHYFLSQLRQVLPQSGHVVGPQTYWLALPDGQYRSFILAFALARQESLMAALSLINPEIVVVDAAMLEWLAAYDAQERPDRLYTDQFWAFMTQRGAQIVAQLYDPTGQSVFIYQLDTGGNR